MNTPPHQKLCGPGYRYPIRVRDLAFQLWAFRCSRRLDCVERELAVVGVAQDWDCIPGERTLRHWATNGDWPAATAQALRTIAPDLSGGLVADLIMGAAEGMVYLRDVLAGRVTQPNSTRIRAILTALSMVGVTDVAHGMIRDGMRKRETEQERPLGGNSHTEPEPESLAAVKARIAVKMGLSSHEAQDVGATSPHLNGV